MLKESIIFLNKQGLADLHIHSCLSPCADLSMSPLNIVKYALEKKLTTIALTDHNTAKNCPAFGKECQKNGLNPLFGMEVNTIEEVHVLCITESLDKALEFDQVLEENILKIKNDPDIFGDQPVINEKEEIVGTIPYYLGASVNFSIDKIFSLLNKKDWLIIPSHINRCKNSLISQLGFIPDLPFDALEISGKSSTYSAFLKYDIEKRIIKTNGKEYPVVINSDLHFFEY
jgi:3',5'-nucleoside bisphosphate phosphatase